MNIGRVFTEAFPLLLKGLAVTIEITIISLVIAFVLGLIACLCNRSKAKILSMPAQFYIWIIRGTPLMVQTFFVYFGVPQVLQQMGFDFRMSAFTAGVITLSLNAGAYLAEIFRGGISAIDIGQTEAARSLGMSKGSTMFKVILPQALRICVPSMVNQVMITLKDTSIIQVISLMEIVYQAKIYIGRTMESFATWTVVALLYLALISIVSWLGKQLERKLNHDSK
ncbi:amino acid ABC transporter permease [Lachnospiraceae bacterium ZAX-1]